MLTITIKGTRKKVSAFCYAVDRPFAFVDGCVVIESPTAYEIINLARDKGCTVVSIAGTAIDGKEY